MKLRVRNGFTFFGTSSVDGHDIQCRYLAGQEIEWPNDQPIPHQLEKIPNKKNKPKVKVQETADNQSTEELETGISAEPAVVDQQPEK